MVSVMRGKYDWLIEGLDSRKFPEDNSHYKYPPGICGIIMDYEDTSKDEPPLCKFECLGLSDCTTDHQNYKKISENYKCL